MATEDSDLALFDDESISSWRLRNAPVCDSIKMQPISRDSDFGDLQLTGPGISARLFARLKDAAKAPDAVLVGTEVGRQCCPRCRVEDWALGGLPYRRRSWRVAWRTCCDRHGLLILEKDVAKLGGVKNPIRHPLIGLSYPRWQTPPRIELRTPRDISVTSAAKLPTASISVQVVGQRAMHLENALSGYISDRYRAWIPRGQGPRELREMYALIVRSIVEWLSLDLTPVVSEKNDTVRKMHACWFKNAAWEEVSVFWRLPPSERFFINVLAEAIISVWTDSPLPGEAGAHRYTDRLAKVLGNDFDISVAARLKAARQQARASAPQIRHGAPRIRSSLRVKRVRAMRVLTAEEQIARIEVMRRFYAVRPKVSGVLRYYECKKIKDRRDLEREDND